MARGPCTFKQRDVTQALKAAVAAGMRVARYEIDRDGTIVVFTANDNVTHAPIAGKTNDWEDVH